MADTVLVSNSAASSNPDYRVWTDELVDPVSGLTVQKQIVGLVDATAGGTTRAVVGANGLAVSATIVGTVPVSLATLPVTNAGTFAVQNTSVIPGVAATSLGKAEDAVAASGDTGVMALAVRNDAGTPLAASGDYIPLMVNASGALYVTGGGGGTQYVEDTASAGGETMTLAGVVRQNTLASSTSADGDYAYLKVNAAGALYTETTGTISVSGNMPVVGAVLEDSAASSGDGGLPTLVVRQDTLAASTSTDGDYAFLKVNAAGALYTETSGSITVSGTMLIDATHLEDAVAASGDTGIPAFAVRRDSASAGGADGDYVNLSTDSVGALRVTGGGGGQQYAEDVAHVTGDLGTGALVVRKDTAAQIAGTDGDYSLLINDASGRVHVNVGTSALPTGAATEVTLAAQTRVDNLVFTDGSSQITAVGYIFDEVAGTALTENDAAAARIDSKRAQIGVLEDATTRGQRAAVSAAGALSVAVSTDAPATTGGWLISRVLSAASTNATSVKASAGKIGGWYLFNANAATRYLKVYNKASAPTVGTDTPVMTIPIPAGAAANVEYSKGIPFATGIALALTTGIADADTGGVAANDIVVNLFYV